MSRPTAGRRRRDVAQRRIAHGGIARAARDRVQPTGANGGAGGPNAVQGNA
jgi:hypothetical protein